MTLKEIINQSNRILILSGAGVSTGSGLPDFRSSEGLYNRREDDPTVILSRDYYNQNPISTIKYIVDNFSIDDKIDANLGHHFAYDLYKQNKLVGVVTQNVDGLYSKTKLPDHLVVEIHGSGSDFMCTQCRRHLTIENINSSYRSECCDAIVDTDVVLYGDNFDQDRYSLYASMINDADLVIVMGTTLNISAHLYNILNIPKRVLINNEKITQFSEDIIDYNFIGDINTILNNDFYTDK